MTLPAARRIRKRLLPVARQDDADDVSGEADAHLLEDGVAKARPRVMLVVRRWKASSVGVRLQSAAAERLPDEVRVLRDGAGGADAQLVWLPTVPASRQA